MRSDPNIEILWDHTKSDQERVRAARLVRPVIVTNLLANPEFFKTASGELVQQLHEVVPSVSTFSML